MAHIGEINNLNLIPMVLIHGIGKGIEQSVNGERKVVFGCHSLVTKSAHGFDFNQTVQ